MSSSLSTHSVALLTLASSAVTCARCASLTPGPAKTPDAPSPSSAGVLGMTRTTAGVRPSVVVSQARRLSTGMPAQMLTTRGSWFIFSLSPNEAASSSQTAFAT